jgi:hypothetical protein
MHITVVIMIGMLVIIGFAIMGTLATAIANNPRRFLSFLIGFTVTMVVAYIIGYIVITLFPIVESPSQALYSLSFWRNPMKSIFSHLELFFLGIIVACVLQAPTQNSWYLLVICMPIMVICMGAAHFDQQIPPFLAGVLSLALLISIGLALFIPVNTAISFTQLVIVFVWMIATLCSLPLGVYLYSKLFLEESICIYIDTPPPINIIFVTTGNLGISRRPMNSNGLRLRDATLK